MQLISTKKKEVVQKALKINKKIRTNSKYLSLIFKYNHFRAEFEF